MKYQIMDLTQKFNKFNGVIYKTREEAELGLLDQLEKYPYKRFKIVVIEPKVLAPFWQDYRQHDPKKQIQSGKTRYG